jgi:hypothetical protein
LELTFDDNNIMLYSIIIVLLGFAMYTTDPDLRVAIFEAFEGKCFWSGRDVQQDAFHVDHVVPVAKGGKDEIENFVLSDPDINKLKSDLMDTDLVDRVLYIVRTVYAPRVASVLSRIKKERLKTKNKRKPPTPRSSNIRIATEDSFEAVWGVPARVAFEHVQKVYGGTNLQIFDTSVSQ